jgi:peroxiredoxin Q/BCP
VKIGDQVPDFELLDDNGHTRVLSEFLSQGPVVLFFYPAAMTTGCTAEACHFRNLGAEFAEVGAQRLGISPDEVGKQRQFSDMYSLDYPLLSDRDGTVAKILGVQRSFGLPGTKRQTFVIDTDRTVLEVIKSEFRMAVHADRALAALKARQTKLA